MFFRTALFLALVAELANAVAVKRAAVNDCLKKARVPQDVSGASNFTRDALPFNARLPYTPAAIAVPTTIPQIQDAVRCALKSGLKATAKSGGHSYASLGLGGENGHLMIELDFMYNVTLNKQTNVATIQPGTRLGHVATQLWNQGKRAISHGTCPGVGIGGHSLGGGYGMVSHSHGLATDWITSMQVVLANGSLVQASATRNSDLFWALRGAGTNMGIVASFQVNTFAAPNEVTYFSMPFKWNETTALKNLRVVDDYARNTMPAELTMRAFLSSFSNYWEGLYFGSKDDLKAALKPLLDDTGLVLQTAVNTTWMSAFSHYANAATDPTVPYSAQENFYAKSLMLKGWTDDSLEAFVRYYYHNTSSNSRSWWMQLDLHGGSNSAVTNGDHSTSSYPHRDKLYLMQFYDRVFFGQYPSNGFQFLDGWVGNTTASLDASDWGAYINYADSQFSKPQAQKLYYGANLPKLQQIKAKYDPGQVFYSPQSIEPAA